MYTSNAYLNNHTFDTNHTCTCFSKEKASWQICYESKWNYPCNDKKRGTLLALLLPLSIPAYLIGIYEQKLLRREFSAIRKTNKEIITIIEKEYRDEL